MVKPWINGWYQRVKIKFQVSTNLVNLNPVCSFYLERCGAAWSQWKHDCFLLQILQEKHSASSQPQNGEGSDRKISPFCSSFPKQKPSRGDKKVQTLKKKSLKVSALVELNGNFLRKSRVVIVFCCLERNSVWQQLWQGRGRQWPEFNQEPQDFLPLMPKSTGFMQEITQFPINLKNASLSHLQNVPIYWSCNDPTHFLKFDLKVLPKSS